MRINVTEPERCMLAGPKLASRCPNEAVDTVRVRLGMGEDDEVDMPICDEHLDMPFRSAQGQAVLAAFRWGQAV